MSAADMTKNSNIEFIFQNEIDSSEEPLMEKWSSLILQKPEESLKRIKYREGLYDPGSGEICTKYIPLSASSILRHPYYNYPAVTDPGIVEALVDPEPNVIYPDDGQELYLKLCKESGLCPISGFHRQLLQNNINLRYYGVQQMAFRIIAMSLKLNKFVSTLDLTDNWINEDGCFHLGAMLAENATLQVLVLQGCRIGPEGARRLFVNLPQNRALRQLNLCKNQLGDEGVEYLAKSISLGADVCDIDLSYNSLTDEAAKSLIDALEINNKLTALNLSWNMIRSPNVIFALCCVLAENDGFSDLDLSWNSLSGARIGKSISVLLKNKNLTNLDLSNNKLCGAAVKPIAKALEKGPPNLISLNLSSNPMTPQDAHKILCPMIKPTVKLRKLLLDNIPVNSNFIALREEILSLKPQGNIEITHGRINADAIRKKVNLKDLVLNRIDYIAKTKYKRRNVDIALIVMQLHKENPEPMDTKFFIREVKNRGLPLEEELADQLTTLFAGPPKPKSTTVNLMAMIDYFKRKWPERQLPPTPPPQPEPEPLPGNKKKKKKK